MLKPFPLKKKKEEEGDGNGVFQQGGDLTRFSGTS